MGNWKLEIGNRKPVVVRCYAAALECGSARGGTPLSLVAERLLVSAAVSVQLEIGNGKLEMDDCLALTPPCRRGILPAWILRVGRGP